MSGIRRCKPNESTLETDSHADTCCIGESALIIRDPISFRQIGEKVWTRRPLNLSDEGDFTAPPAGHVIMNTITDPSTEVPVNGNDCSLHLFEQEAAAAWLITRNEDEYISAVFLLREASITSLSSYMPSKHLSVSEIY